MKRKQITIIFLLLMQSMMFSGCFRTMALWDEGTKYTTTATGGIDARGRDLGYQYHQLYARKLCGMIPTFNIG